MIFVAIIVAFLVSAVLAQGSGPSPKYTGKPEKNWCPPHVWQYNDKGFLQCTVCNREPGYTPRE